MSKQYTKQNPCKAGQYPHELSQITNIETGVNRARTQSNQNSKPCGYETSRCPVPIGSKSKDKISSLRKSRQGTDQYFQKQLEIRTLQSKKLVQELQQTKNRLNQSEKQCWFMKNEYESEKRKVAKWQNENARLNEQIKDLESKIYLVKQDVCEKEELDERYLENLQSLRVELKEKQEIIQQLKMENKSLERRLSEGLGNVVVESQRRISKSVENSKLSATIDFEVGNRYPSTILPPPRTVHQETSNRPVTRSLEKGFLPRHQHIYTPDKQNQFMRPKYKTIQTCDNLQQLSANLETLSPNYHLNTIDRYRLTSALPNHHSFYNIPGHSSLYPNQPRKYSSSHNSQRNQKRFSYDYGSQNQGPLADMTRRYNNNERLGTRKLRKDKGGESVMNRYRMILDY